MKKITILLAVLSLLILGGLYWYFSMHKKIVKDKLQDTVTKKTDGLYKLTYDSSTLDEVGGDASFINVKLKVDSVVLAQFIAEGKAPALIVDLELVALKIDGLESIGLLKEESVDAKTIILEEPVLKFFKIARINKEELETDETVLQDTTEIFERLLGQYNLIKADSILIRKGYVEWNDNIQNKKIFVEEVDCAIHNFRVDSLHRYKNIASYFLKDASLRARNFRVTDSTGNKNVAVSDVDYVANEGRISVNNIFLGNKQTIKAIKVRGLNTYDFIYRNEINCKTLWLNDVYLSIRKTRNKAKPSDSLSIALPEILTSLKVDTLSITDGHLQLTNGNKKTVELDGIQANLYKTVIDTNGISLRSILEDGLFRVLIASIKVYPKKGVHTIQLGNLRYLNAGKALFVETFKVTPTIAKNDPSVTGNTQQDLFSIVGKNINVSEFDLEQFVYNELVSAKKISLSIDLRVLTDKFHGNNTVSRLGQYPHQLLQKLKYKVHIPNVHVQNSRIQYTERKAKTGQTGTLYFSNVNGDISNFSNTTKGSMKLVSEGRLMNEGKAQAEWDFPMNASDGRFFVKGTLKGLNLMSMNDVAKNLADAEILSGSLTQLDFTMNGTNTSSSGEVVFTYKDLKIKILKDGESGLLKNAKVVSFLANAAIKNNQSEPVRQSYTNQRDKTKSFFNLLWKSIFEGIKNTVLIKPAKSINKKK